jgi:hypothetical protein
VGTGTYRQTFTAEALLAKPPLEQGLRSLQSLMDDCVHVNQGILQWLTRCVTPRTIDRAVQDMKPDSEAGPQLATYARYNVELEAGWLKTELEIDRTHDKLARIAEMDNPSNMNELAAIGKVAAERQVKAEHFPADFDV